MRYMAKFASESKAVPSIFITTACNSIVDVLSLHPIRYT